MSGNGNLPVGLRHKTGRHTKLRDLLADEKILAAPGAFDCISARLVQNAGFDALYLTGSGMSMSLMGSPDLGMLSYSEIMDHVRRITDTVEIPVIADADTGYGGPLNVVRTTRDFEAAGVSCIQIEDQQWPKRCGHMLNRTIVSIEEMCGRIKAAVDIRDDPDFVVMARADARTDHGIDEAIERMNAYIEAGADVAFVESPETADEMKMLNEQIPAPTLANMVEGGRTPFLPFQELQSLGYNLVIYPGAMGRVLGRSGAIVLDHLKETGSTDGMQEMMLDQPRLFGLFDYYEWTDYEAKFGANEDA
ncbi:MAG: carboxyvinyl-carboxyphosphonate phosphorylmutase [Rhodospirillaceae bacterium]|nr:carboxyvinyl-carboxyphosphonate phosphorylmutase [Rhodospirillaceae bacterium]